jgi:hypothetical protein
VTQLVYVYGIAESGSSIVARGINDQPVRWIGEGQLAAAVSDVPAEEFDEEPLNAGLTDMNWLGPHAVAHQDVNQRLHEQSDALIPLAFGTVFRDDGRVRALLREQAASLNERLSRVRGRSEWVVTVHRTSAPDLGASGPLQELQAEIDAAAPGRAHLLRRRLAELERDEARRLERESVDGVLAALRGVAQDVFVEPLPTDVVDRPLLRVSVLVERGGEDRFVDTVDALQAGSLRVLVTGPWPPYRFGGLEHAAATS